jgi:hypothetical protein
MILIQKVAKILNYCLQNYGTRKKLFFFCYEMAYNSMNLVCSNLHQSTFKINSESSLHLGYCNRQWGSTAINKVDNLCPLKSVVYQKLALGAVLSSVI